MIAVYADIFWQFFRLGLTSFGGPAAHLVYFERQFVQKNAWLSAVQYQQLVALCQFLPGPASSQVGIGIGLQRGGHVGAALAFLGFTLPSFTLMLLAGLVGLHWLGSAALQGALCALAAIVAHAIWQMSQSLTPDWLRRGLASIGFAAFLWLSDATLQLLVLLLFALAGALILKPASATSVQPWQGRTKFSLPLLLVFVALLITLPLFAASFHDVAWLQIVQSYFQAGAFVFGGGHVVLPLLEQSVGSTMSQTDFLAGYAAAQLMPGPLFSFAAYLGAASAGVFGAALATLALFLPGALLVCAIWPWWHRLSQYPQLLGAVAAVNCAVVGLLGATWWQSILPHASSSIWHGLLLLLGFICLVRNWCKPMFLVPIGMLIFWLAVG